MSDRMRTDVELDMTGFRLDERIAAKHAGLVGCAIDVGPDGIAIFSPCSLWRYYLTRTWDRISPPKIATWIMCNPSTADAFTLDPTIRRCVEFSKREGCTGLVVVNVYAYRSVKPDVLNHVEDPIGRENFPFVASAIANTDIVIAAWGAFRAKINGHRQEPIILIRSYADGRNRPVYALKRTADGSPGHPLYVRADAPLEPMWPAIYFTTEAF